MPNRDVLLPAVLIGLGVLLFPGHLLAQSGESTRLMNYRFGDLLIRPSVSQSLQYDDNILLEDSSTTSDVISRSTLGLSFTYPTALNVSLNHRTTVKEFLDNKKFNDVENRTSGRLQYSSESVTLGVSGYRLKTSEPLDLVFANRQKLTRNEVSPYFTFRLGSLSTEIKYRNTRFKYDDSNFSSFNYRDESARLRSTYALSRTGFFRIGLAAGRITYDDDTLGDSLGINNPYFEATVGGGGHLTESVKTVLEVGAHVRSDLEELVATGDTTDIEAFDALLTIPVAEATAIWTKSPSEKITAGYLRSVGKSSLSNHVERDRLKAQYKRRVSEKVGTRTSLSYIRAEESADTVPQAEKDSYRFQLESTYQYKPWLPVSLLYTYYEKATNDGVGEFTVHRLGVSVTGRF